MKQLKALISKELINFFGQPTAYIFAAVFILVNNFFFFSNFFLNNQASLRNYFQFFPLTLAFFIPLVTMGAISGEYKNDTIETLLSLPLKKSQIVLAKFAASIIFFLFALLFTLPVVLIVFLVGKPDIGPIITSYLASIMLVFLYTSIGLFASSVTREHLISLLVGVISLFGLYLCASPIVLEKVPFIGQVILSIVSPTSHFDNFAKGLILIKDIIYFISVSWFFCWLTVQKIDFEAK